MPTQAPYTALHLVASSLELHQTPFSRFQFRRPHNAQMLMPRPFSSTSSSTWTWNSLEEEFLILSFQVLGPTQQPSETFLWLPPMKAHASLHWLAGQALHLELSVSLLQIHGCLCKSGNLRTAWRIHLKSDPHIPQFYPLPMLLLWLCRQHLLCSDLRTPCNWKRNNKKKKLVIHKPQLCWSTLQMFRKQLQVEKSWNRNIIQKKERKRIYNFSEVQ